MRTPGDDTDLAIGFLFTEGVIQSAEQIQSLGPPDRQIGRAKTCNILDVQLKSGVRFDIARLARNFHATSSCGVCGKATIDSIAVRVSTDCRIAHNGPMVQAETIHRLPDALRKTQRVFDRTGGLHAAALFDKKGELLEVREDVGRHNAVDKLIGHAISSSGLRPLSEYLMLVSGRAGFELVQKAAVARIPVMAAVGAPSSLAVETALRFGMTLLGFVRGSRFNSYANGWRIQ
jgi:FdhD protein